MFYVWGLQSWGLRAGVKRLTWRSRTHLRDVHAGLLPPLPLGLHACHVQPSNRLLVAGFELERLAERSARLGGLVLCLQRQRQPKVPLGEFGRELRARERVLSRLGVAAKLEEACGAVGEERMLCVVEGERLRVEDRRLLELA